MNSHSTSFFISLILLLIIFFLVFNYQGNLYFIFHALSSLVISFNPYLFFLKLLGSYIND